MRFEMKAIRVLIADDHGVLRAGLRALLESEAGMEVVGEAGSGEEALLLAQKLLPDVVLMDVSMPEIGGIEATRRLVKKLPEARVLILTVHEDGAMLQEAIQAGAAGYVLKRALKPELIMAIQAVARGDLYIHPSMTRNLFPTSARRAAPRSAGVEQLTAREVEILRLIAQGYTNSQVGNLLKISVRTVEYHRGNLMGKLALQSRVELVRFASENSLLDGQNGKI
jgi:two-component system response regulator NreC